MKSKKIIKVMLAITMLVIGFGCQDKPSQNIVISQKETDTIQLHFFGFKSEAMNVMAIEDALQNYMQEHPNIQITYESIKGTEYYDVLEKRLKSGNYDDIFMIDEDHLQSLKNDGYFENLSKLSTISDFSQKSLEQMIEENGEIYYVPSSISAFGLYCNMELLKKYNQSVPQNEKEFFEVCQYFVEQGITPIVANNDISLKTISIAKGLYPLYQKDNYKDIIQDMNKDSRILINYMRKGYEFVEDMIQNEYVNVEQALETEKTKDDLELFVKGENPFMLTGAWAAVRVEAMNPTLKFEVHPLPILENGSILVTNIDTRLCVNAKGQHVKEAKDFIEYITQDEVMWKFVDSQCSFSPLDENKLSTNKAVQPLSDYFTTENTILGSDALINYEMWSLTRKGVQVLLKGGSVEEALEIIEESK